MNKARRKALGALHLDALKEQLESIRDDEQEAFDNLPESLQGGERGDAMTEWVDAIEEAISGLDTLIEKISE
jgi:hypothetical protein